MLNTTSIAVRRAYGATNASARVPRATTCSGGPGGGSTIPVSAATRSSSALTTRSASAKRPWAASQRGLSGTWRRMNHTATALTEPISTTQRQLPNPSGLVGTSSQASSATVGTEANCTVWFTANARPRIVLGTSSLM